MMSNNTSEHVHSHEELRESSFVIIAPDDSSGRAFESRFNAQNLKLDYQEISVRSRLVGDEKSTNFGVHADLLDAFRQEYSKGHTNIIIACNTLQFWAEELAQHPELYEDMPNLKVYSTFSAAKEAYPDRNNRPMWLGTTVTSTQLSKNDFDTPLNSSMPDIQKSVQELIWRTKATSTPPSDYSGATASNIVDITNQELLDAKVRMLVKDLKDHGVTEFFLGCTELPVAFSRLSESDLEGITVINPADLMAAHVKNQLSPTF